MRSHTCLHHTLRLLPRHCFPFDSQLLFGSGKLWLLKLYTRAPPPTEQFKPGSSGCQPGGETRRMSAPSSDLDPHQDSHSSLHSRQASAPRPQSPHYQTFTPIWPHPIRSTPATPSHLSQGPHCPSLKGLRREGDGVKRDKTKCGRRPGESRFGTGRGRAVPSGKWEGGRGAWREAPVARDSEPERSGERDSAIRSPAASLGLAHSAAPATRAVSSGDRGTQGSLAPTPNPALLAMKLC